MIALLFNGSGVLCVLQEGGYTFSLEAVKVLWQALEEVKYWEASSNAARPPSRSQSHILAVCSHPALPDDFRPLCQDPNAEEAFANLGRPTACRLSAVMSVCSPRLLLSIRAATIDYFHRRLNDPPPPIKR